MLVVGVIEDQRVTKAPHLLLLPGEPPLCTTRPPRGGIQEALGGPLGGHWGAIGGAIGAPAEVIVIGTGTKVAFFCKVEIEDLPLAPSLLLKGSGGHWDYGGRTQRASAGGGGHGGPEGHQGTSPPPSPW